MNTKICNVCNEEKIVSMFTKGKGACMKCRNKKRIQNYKTEREETKEELREEFKTKHNMKPDEDMLHRYFDTDYGEHEHIFIAEETFEKLMKDLNEKYPDKEPKAVKPPQQIYDMIAEREKEDMKYVRDIKHIFLLPWKK